MDTSPDTMLWGGMGLVGAGVETGPAWLDSVACVPGAEIEAPVLWWA